MRNAEYELGRKLKGRINKIDQRSAIGVEGKDDLMNSVHCSHQLQEYKSNVGVS